MTKCIIFAHHSHIISQDDIVALNLDSPMTLKSLIRPWLAPTSITKSPIISIFTENVVLYAKIAFSLTWSSVLLECIIYLIQQMASIDRVDVSKIPMHSNRVRNCNRKYLDQIHQFGLAICHVLSMHIYRLVVCMFHLICKWYLATVVQITMSRSLDWMEWKKIKLKLMEMRHCITFFYPLQLSLSDRISTRNIEKYCHFDFNILWMKMSIQIIEKSEKLINLIALWRFSWSFSLYS